MLALFRSCVTDQDIVAIHPGHGQQRSPGRQQRRPKSSSVTSSASPRRPQSDQIDRDEWEHYQKDIINLQEMQQNPELSPRRKVGNDIVRTGLPIMTEARVMELATQLRQSCPIPEEVVETTGGCELRSETIATRYQSVKLKDAASRSTLQHVTLHACSPCDQRRSTNDHRFSLHAPRVTLHAWSPYDQRRSTNDHRFPLYHSHSTRHQCAADTNR